MNERNETMNINPMANEQEQLDQILDVIGVPCTGPFRNCEAPGTTLRFGELLYPEGKSIEEIVEGHVTSLPDYTDRNGEYHRGLDTPEWRRAFISTITDALYALLDICNGDHQEVCDFANNMLRSDAIEEVTNHFGDWDGTMIMIYLTALADAAEAIKHEYDRGRRGNPAPGIIRNAFQRCGLEMTVSHVETIPDGEAGAGMIYYEYLIKGKDDDGENFEFYLGFHGEHTVKHWMDRIKSLIDQKAYSEFFLDVCEKLYGELAKVA